MLADAVVLLQEAKALVKRSGFASAADLIKVLARMRLSKKYDVFSSNIFRFCGFILNQHQGRESYIHQFNSLLGFLESGNVISNCRSFVPKNASILSNISVLNSYGRGKVDFVLISAEAITENSVILNSAERSMLAFACSNNIPVYAVSSILGIDVHSVYHPGLCARTLYFDGVISEYGCTSIDSFFCSARASFSWLFF